MTLLPRARIVRHGPLLLRQVLEARTRIPRLPEARGLREGLAPVPGTAPAQAIAPDAPAPLRLLVLGDSTAMGVGASSLAVALPGSLARAVAERTGHAVAWRAVGRSGADSPEVLRRHLGRALDRRWDIVYLALGTNDTMHLLGPGLHQRTMGLILRALRRGSPDALILVASQPAFRRFESLPEPLRGTLADLADALEQRLRRLAAGMPGVLVGRRPVGYPPGFFAADGFHPSAVGYAAWAEDALDEVEPELLRRFGGAQQPARAASPEGALGGPG